LGEIIERGPGSTLGAGGGGSGVFSRRGSHRAETDVRRLRWDWRHRSNAFLN
jgi:hypothetical protein